MSERMTEARLQTLNLKLVTSEGLSRDDVVELLSGMDAARSEEARLLEELKTKDECIKELGAAVSVVMGSMTTFGLKDVIVIMRREEYKKVLDAKVSP